MLHIKRFSDSSPERTFGQLLLVRTKRQHKLEERGRLGIMAGTYPGIPNGVIVLSVYTMTLLKKLTQHMLLLQRSVIRIDGSLSGIVPILIKLYMSIKEEKSHGTSRYQN